MSPYPVCRGKRRKAVETDADDLKALEQTEKKLKKKGERDAS